MAGEALGNSNILGRAVQICARRVTNRMEVIGVFDARALLPIDKQRSDLARGQSIMLLTQEQRGVGGKAFAPLLLPPQVLQKLYAKGLRQNDILRGRRLGAALEHAKTNAPSNGAIVARDVAHVERHNLVFAQAGSERNCEKHVIAKTILAFSSRLEKRGLLAGGKGFGRRWNRVDEQAHRDGYTLCLTNSARQRDEAFANSARAKMGGEALNAGGCQAN